MKEEKLRFIKEFIRSCEEFELYIKEEEDEDAAEHFMRELNECYTAIEWLKDN